jgi:hypothetical protein
MRLTFDLHRYLCSATEEEGAMNILETLLSSQGGDALRQVGSSLGLDPGKTEAVLGRLLPALTGGMKQNLTRQGGVQALTHALESGNHQRYLDEPSALQDDQAVSEGNAILGHLLGGKEESRNVAGQVAGDTGIDSSIVRKMLPIAAAALMGALSKGTSRGASLGSSSGAGLLSGLLDSDGDGQVLDDLMALGKKLF